MKDYLNNVLEDRDNYYLKDVLAARINAVNFIGKDKKDEYISKINKAIDENYINGVERLNNALDEYFGKATSNNSSYLASYEKGKELYLLKLSNLLGIENLNIEEYIAEIDEMLTYSVNKIISTQNSMIKKYKITSYAQLENLLQGQIIFEGTPEEMMGYLKEFAKTIVPELKEEPEITIKNMDDASAEASNAVAYYIKSALDNTDPEEITLNQLKLGDANNTLSTLGHEGYPGHLYAYCYSKEIDIHNIAKIMTSTAHGEGLATYTQLKLYEYDKKSSKDSKFKDVMNYLYYNDLSSFLLETRIDVGIHYEGWSVSKVAKFLGDLGYNSDAAQEIYDLIIEMPSQYAAYGYGKLVIYNLHEDAKNILGDHYNEIEFNSMILSKGWSSMDALRNTYNDYMAQEINRYNISVDVE
jgi:uncharacterized protein (DUF885 family)